MSEQHAVVTHDEWVDARKALLAKEKEFTRLRDDLSRQRRDLPWEPVDKEYVFDGPNGKETLGGLFDGRSQLLVYHFMFDPSWDEGCALCSFWADSFDANVVHLEARDVTMIAVSRAPFAKLAAYEQRMGWSFHWVSSFESAFNFDYGVSFSPEEQATEGTYNYATHPGIEPEREGGGQRLQQGRERTHLPHVLDVRAWNRHGQHRLPLPRPRSFGTRRGRAAASVLGTAAR